MKKKISLLISMLMTMQLVLSTAAMPAFAEEPETSAYTVPESPSVTYNMNVDWKYKRAADGSEYPLETAASSVLDAEGRHFYEVDYDDSEWETVSVPHPVNAADSFDGNCYDAGEAGLYRGFMFYRKNVTIPASDAGKKMFLEFEAVRNSVYLYVNGEMVGYYEAGIAATGFDITDYVKPGEDNIIAVATDNSADRGQSDASKVTHETRPGSEPGAADGFGYQWNTKDFNEVQGGITGNVNLYAKGTVYQTLPLYNNLKTTGNYIYGSDFDIDGNSATINVKAEVRNETDTDMDVTLQVDVVGMDGTLAYTFESQGNAAAASDRDVHIMNTVPQDAYAENPAPTDISTVDVSYIEASYNASNMRFWSDTDPYLYTVYTILKNGEEVIDVQKTVTGFRKVEYDINNGLRVNDKNVYLKGYAQRSTDEWAVIGVANDWLNDIDMGLIRESNANHIRWMHVAPKPVEVRSSDKYGVIVVCPAGDKEADVDGRAWDQRVEAMRDAMIYFRNNPSVMFWEAGNNQVSAAHMQEITDLKSSLDPNGGRFAGCRTINSVEQVAAAEYVGTMLNRNASAAKTSMTSLDKFMPIMETEYARDEAPRRVWDDFSPPDYDYVNKYLDHSVSKEDGYDVWDETSEDFAVNNAKAYDEFWSGRVTGGGSELYSGAAIMVWSDSNMHNRNTYTENCRTSGKVDAVRIKKEAFYSLQAVQSSTPKIHVVGHWNYPEYIEGDTKNGNYWYEDRTYVNNHHFEPNGNMLQRNPKEKTVYVIGSPDISKVELYINNELVNTDYKPDNSFVYAFPNVDVTQSGEVKAIAYDESDIAVAEDIITTAGAPDHIKLTPVTGPDGLIADGSDVMYFDVEVVDENDNVCPLNYDRIDLTVNGEAVLLGGYNSGVGDKITTGKDYVYAECGVNRVFVRSTRNAGTFTLSATMDGLGTAEYSLTSVAYENSVDGAEGLSTQMQRSYGLGEQAPQVEPKAEAFKPLAAAVKADFSENGNTKVVSDIDDTVYYTVQVNGEELSLDDSVRARASSGLGVFGPIAPVLSKLNDAGAIKSYSVENGVLTFNTAEHKYTVKVGENAIYEDDAANGTEITENAEEINGEMFVNYNAVLGYIPGVVVAQDNNTLICTIMYEPAAKNLVSVAEENKTALAYSDGNVVISAAEPINGAKLAFAAYESGRLVKLLIQDVSVEAGGTSSIAVPAEIKAAGNAQKAMLWKSMESMEPLCDVVPLEEPVHPIESASPDPTDKATEPPATSAPSSSPTESAKYEVVQYSENYSTDTRTDSPDGTGYLTPEANTKIFEGMGTILQSESLISLDFRFDNASGSMSIKNGDVTGGKWGPNFSFDGTNFRTQTGSKSYQNLGEIEAGKWYSMELEGTIAIANSSVTCRIYKYENGNKVLIQETPGMNLRQLASNSNGVADYFVVFSGISVDNVSVTSLYADAVSLTALKNEINANESVSLTATATRNGAAVTVPEFAWSLYDENGNALTDSTISVENGMLFTTKETAAQTVTVRATAQTAGNPYGETKIKINAIDVSNDTFNEITLSSDKNYVRSGENTTITPSVSLNGAAVTPADEDIVWSVYNAANIREVKNRGIKVENGIVTVNEDVIPQTITVRASNKSGSATADIQLNVRPGTMILDGESGNKDTFVSGDACEEFITGISLQEDSWDGTGYYKLTAPMDFVGFPANTTEHVLYSADMRFDTEGSGWTVWNSNKGKQGLQVIYTGGKLGIVKDSSNTSKYCDIDNDSWYNVQIMCSTGVNPNSYANLIVYKYVDGKRVHPETGEENVPYIANGIPMRNLAESSANHIVVATGTSVDNVYCAKTTPDNISVSVDKTSMFAGQSIQGSVTASRKGVPFGYISSDLIKWVVYNEENTAPLGSDLIKVDASGKLTVDARADSQIVNLRASTIDGALYDSVKIAIQSSDIFTVHTIGFDESYTKVVELDVTKNFAYSDDVTFAVCVYDSEEMTLKSITTKTMSGKSIARGEEPVTVSMDAQLPADFDKESDVLYVYTLTSVSENEAVTEADGMIEAQMDGDVLQFTKLPEFDASQQVYVLVLKGDAVTTAVNDSDIVYFKQFNGTTLAGLDKIKCIGAENAGYIIKMAGKINGVSTIYTGIAAK